MKIETVTNLGENSCLKLKKEYDCGRCLELQSKITNSDDKCARLEREKLDLEFEVRVLKQRNEELEKVVANGGLDDDDDDEDKVTQLMIENKVLECEKNKAESDIEAWKVKCKDLEIQVFKLEKRLSNLPEIDANEDKGMSGTPPVNLSLKQYTDAGVMNGGFKFDKSSVRRSLDFASEKSPYKSISPSTPGGPRFGLIDISDSDDDDDDLNTAHIRSRDLDRKRIALDETKLSSKGSDEEDTRSPNLVTPRAKRVKREVAYIIRSESESDNDDNIPICRLISTRLSVNDTCPMDKLENHTPRRRLTRLRNRGNRDVEILNTTNEDDDEDEIEEVDSGSEGESLGGFIVSNSDVSESGPVSSSDDISKDDGSGGCSVESVNSMEYVEIISSLRRERKDKKEWEYEADMLADFGRCPKLCMKAVCALYRQQTSEEQSCKATIDLNGRGFSHFHATSGSVLAEFLSDGDPDCDVMKSVEELKEFDPNGVELCRKYATHYSKQLFEIYKNGEDPFFHP